MYLNLPRFEKYEFKHNCILLKFDVLGTTNRSFTSYKSISMNRSVKIMHNSFNAPPKLLWHLT